MSETRPPSQLTSPSISAPGGALRQRRKRNRGYAIHQTTPAGEAGGSSFEEEALVKLQPVVLDQLADFFLERTLLVMLFLPVDVTAHVGDL